MFSVCRQSSHIFQVTRGMYCTNNEVFLSQENAYMGTFQWILRNEGWFLYVRLPPMVSNFETHCFFSSIFVSMVENIILRLLDGSLRRLVSKFKVQTSSQPNRWVYVSEIFILSFFFLFFLLSSTNPSNSLSLPFSFPYWCWHTRNSVFWCLSDMPVFVASYKKDLHTPFFFNIAIYLFRPCWEHCIE